MRSDVSTGSKPIEGLECIICHLIIPVERQQFILKTKPSCEYCAGCQDIMDRKKNASM